MIAGRHIYKLKLHSKKLSSGRCQIKFEFLQAESPAFYGYLLVDGTTPLREVVQEIYQKTERVTLGDYFHEHLFHLEKRDFSHHPLFLFKN